jgi:hypothetical protein
VHNASLQDDDWRKEIDKNALDDSWEEEDLQVSGPIIDFPFPFQATLIKFLDKRAPLPGIATHINGTPQSYFFVIISDLVSGVCSILIYLFFG